MASLQSDEVFKVAQLFGGAFTCNLPSAFQDVSSLREIPDNQEVWAHSSCDQSIIVELVEYQNIPDHQAARYHFQDLAESNSSTQEETQVLSVSPLSNEQLSMAQVSSGWLLSGTQTVSKFNKPDKSTIKILLSVLRLPAHTTDILVSFNCPIELGADDDTEMFASVLKSLKLLNPSIFA